MAVLLNSPPVYEDSIFVADMDYPTFVAFHLDVDDQQVWEDRDNLNVISPAMKSVVGNLMSAYQTEPSRRVSTPVITTSIVKRPNSHPPLNFVDRLYYRVHIVPKFIDVGNLVGPQVFPASMWNAHFTYTDPLLVQEIGTDGVTLVFPDGQTIPFSIKPLETIPMEFEVSATVGPPNIFARFNFIYNTGQQIEVRLEGARTQIWPVAPDMGQAYAEKFTWNTDIITAETGLEQRISLREYPEVSVEASYTAFRDDSFIMDSILWGWQLNVWGYPLHHLPVKLTQKVEAGNTVLHVTSTEGKRFDLGNLGIFYCSINRKEAFEVGAVTEFTITLTRPAQEDWPAGTTVLPMRLARTEKDLQMQWPTSDNVTVKARFTYLDDEPVPAEDADELYKGYYILKQKPNWVEPLSQDVVRNADVVSNDVGHIAVLVHSPVPTVTRNFLFYFNGLSHSYKFLKWCYARRGMQVPFWVPSWTNDMRIMEDMSIAREYIKIKNRNYSGLYKHRDTRGHILIVLKTGEAYPRKILHIVTDPSNPDLEIVTLDAPFPADHKASMVNIVCFMGLNRLASDEVSLDWRSDQLVEVNSKMKTIITKEVPDVI